MAARRISKRERAASIASCASVSASSISINAAASPLRSPSCIARSPITCSIRSRMMPDGCDVRKGAPGTYRQGAA